MTEHATICPNCNRETLLKDLKKDLKYNYVCCVQCEDRYDKDVTDAWLEHEEE